MEALPDVHQHKLDDLDELVIIASDGTSMFGSKF